MIQIKITTKFLLLFFGIIILAFTVFSFTNYSTENPNKGRTIEVIGSAEMSLKPDKIKLRIQLTFNNQNRKEKEEKLFKILKKHGIDEDKVELTSYNGYGGIYYNWYRYYYELWYYNNSYYHNYDLPIDNTIDPQKLMHDLKKPAVHGLWIENDGFKDITGQRKKVKIAAIQAAKEKASYLLEAVGEKLGTVVSIQEVKAQGNTNHFNPYWGYGYRNQNSLSSSSSNVSVSSNQNKNETVKGAATDKLKYEVKVLFTIQ